MPAAAQRLTRPRRRGPGTRTHPRPAFGTRQPPTFGGHPPAFGTRPRPAFGGFPMGTRPVGTRLAGIRWVGAAGCLTILLAACEEPPAAKVVGSRGLPPAGCPLGECGPLLAASEAAAPTPAVIPAAAPAPQPIECRAAPGRSATALIDSAGGSVSVAGVAVMLPPGAVSSPTGVTVTVQPSPVMRIAIRAVGADATSFEQPALVTVDYAGCPVPPAGEAPLSVWRLDAAAERPVEKMEGEDDRELRLITFVAGTASQYTIAR